MKKLSITGANGNIGKRLAAMGCESLVCDVRSREDVERELRRVNPDVIIHLAAKSDPTFCENNYDEAIAVNTFGTNIVCEVAEKVLGKGKVVLISADQVFDGKKGNYKENAELHPINNYGLTKFAAEGIANLYDDKIIRISRCVDSKSKDISDYLEKLKNGEVIEVPEHIFRSYTHYDFIAEAIYQYAQRFDEMPKTLHLGGWWPVSFYSLIYAIAEDFMFDLSLLRPRGEVDGFSKRPAKCGLNVSLAKKLRLPIYDMYKSIERLKNEHDSYSNL